MASVNKVILIGNLGRGEDVEMALRRFEKIVLDRYLQSENGAADDAFNPVAVRLKALWDLKSVTSARNCHDVMSWPTELHVQGKRRSPWSGLARGPYFSSQRPNARNAP